MAPTGLDRELFLQLHPAELRGQLDRLDRVRWALNRAKLVLPPLGSPLDLRDHAFLRQPLRDPAPEIVVMKGAQLGFTTVAIIRALHFLTEIGGTVIYSFPTTSDVSDFTQERINPLIRQTPYLTARIVDVNSVKQKQFLVADDAPLAHWRSLPPAFRPAGAFPRSTIHFTGSSSVTDPVSTPADMLSMTRRTCPTRASSRSSRAVLITAATAPSSGSQRRGCLARASTGPGRRATSATG